MPPRCILLYASLLAISYFYFPGDCCTGTVKRAMKKVAFKVKGAPTKAASTKVTGGGRPKGVPPDLAPGFSLLADVTKKASRKAPKKPPVNMKRTLAVGAGVGVVAGAAAAAGGSYALIKHKENEGKKKYVKKAMEAQEKLKEKVGKAAANLQERGKKLKEAAAALAG